jgi:hypothetical protein
MNQILGGMSPTYGNYIGIKSLTSYNDIGGKVPTFENYVGKKPSNRY